MLQQSQGGTVMPKRKRLILISSTLIILATLLYILGFRLTAHQAAMDFFEVEADTTIVKEIKYDKGIIYLMNGNDKYQTILTRQHGFLWSARVGFYMPIRDDLIQVKGWASSTDCSLVALEVSDPQVDYIEMGEHETKQRIDVNPNELHVFLWNQGMTWQDMNGIAYSKTGTVLYKFTYPNSTIINTIDLGWYPVNTTIGE